MAIKRMVVKIGEKPTAEQLNIIDEAASRPITFDEDCPELTEDECAQFALLAKEQRAARKKQLVSLRLSPATLEKAKKLGKGYTGILSRLLDLAINDQKMLKQCL